MHRVKRTMARFRTQTVYKLGRDTCPLGGKPCRLSHVLPSTTPPGNPENPRTEKTECITAQSADTELHGLGRREIKFEKKT